MSWLSKLRAQPIHKRMIILWSAVGASAALLFLAWLLIGNYNPHAGQKDTSLFQALSTGFKNLDKQDIAGQARQETILQQKQQQQIQQSNSK